MTEIPTQPQVSPTVPDQTVTPAPVAPEQLHNQIHTEAMTPTRRAIAAGNG